MNKFSFCAMIALCLLPVDATSLQDKLIAVVDQKPLTEKDVIERYNLYKFLSPDSYQHLSYQDAKDGLLDELCVDTIIAELWDQMTQNRVVDMPQEQLAEFQKKSNWDPAQEKAVRKLYAATIKKDRLSRHILQSKMTVSQQEILSATKQPLIWEALDTQWSFDLAYSSHPFDKNKTIKNFKELKNLSTAQISPSLLQMIDWQKKDAWQFFKIDDEYIAFRLHQVAPKSFLPTPFQIQLIEKNAPSADNETFRIKSYQDLPQEGFDILWKTPVGSCSDETFIMGNKEYYLRVISKEPLINQQDIIEQMTVLIKTQKAQEALPAWLAELKNDHFIQILQSKNE